MKKRVYSIIILICLMIILSSIPVSFFISNKYISFSITIFLKLLFIPIFIFYRKKWNLKKPLFEKIKINSIKLLPFIFICFSNLAFVFIFGGEKNSIFDPFLFLLNIIISLLTAVNEELIFRSLILGELLDNTNKKKAIFYSALIFGSIHLLNITSFSHIHLILAQVVYTFFLGLFLSLVYVLTKNIGLSIILHFCFNAINDSLVIYLYSYDMSLYYYLFSAAYGLIFIIYFIFLFFRIDEGGSTKNVS